MTSRKLDGCGLAWGRGFVAPRLGTHSQAPEHSDERLERQADLDTETTITLARLSYVGTGWMTTGDALLANTAADQAGREELAHLQGA